MESDGGRIGEGVAQARREAEELATGVQEQLEGLRGYAEDAGEWIRGAARERPMVAIAVAAGIGFVLGRLLSRA